MVFSHPYLSYDSSKPYVVGTHNNRLTETILFDGQIRIWVCEILPQSEETV